MQTLHIGPDFKLPYNFVTQANAILARKRAGKTYTGSVIAEELVKAKIPFVVLDPTSAWWGLRAAADGKGPGLPVVVIGGAHGDLPLDPEGGALVADLVVDHPSYYVLDLSLFESDAAQDRFSTAFAKRLYRRKQVDRSPLHLFVDEADMVVPQNPQPGQQTMLGAFNALVRRSGIMGLGVTLISQRAALVSKSVLNMTEMMIVLQTTGPHDQDAVLDWAKRQAPPEVVKQLAGELAKLGRGEAWLMSPSWLNRFGRVQVRARHTFNSSATPELGAKRVEPKVLAKVDLESLRAKLAATVEHAKANDPAALKRRIAELERAQEHGGKANHQVWDRVRTAEAALASAKAKIIEVPVLRGGEVNRLEKLVVRIDKHMDKSDNARNEAKILSGTIARALEEFKKRSASTVGQTVKFTEIIDIPKVRTLSSRETSKAFGSDTIGLSTPQHRILDAVSWLSKNSHGYADKIRVAFLADQSPTSSGYTNNLSALRTGGYIEYPSAGKIVLTDKGHAAAQPSVRESNSEALQAVIIEKLPNPQRRIMRYLVSIHPRAVTKEALGPISEQSPTSSGFTNNLSALRTLGLLDYPSRGEVVATDAMFLQK